MSKATSSQNKVTGLCFLFKFLRVILYVYECFACMYVYVPGDCRGQQGALESGIEVMDVVSCHVGTKG